MKTSNINKHRNLFFNGIMTLVIVFSLSIFLSSCTKNSITSSTFLPTPVLKQVIMYNSSYNPQTVTVSQGTTIIWINSDPYDHTITSGTPGHPSGIFDSGDITPHGEYSYTFDSIGTYDYYCKLYLDKMTGTVIVK